MNARFSIILAAALFFFPGAPSAPAGQTSLLPPAAEQRVDALVQAKLEAYDSLNVGLIRDGKIVLVKAYGEGRLDGEYQYGSVSKPLTSTIILMLRRRGLIKSLDDNLWDYLPDLKEAMPEAYKGSLLTLRHLLTHMSGIPHNDEPPLIEGKFNLKFRPGAEHRYSTPGYGFLGRVIEAVAGMKYSDAVRIYLGKPVKAESLHALDSFIAPGAFVVSTIEDMARVALGMMTGEYLPVEVLTREAWQPVSNGYGLGWSVENVGTPEMTAFHGGSNGLPHAYFLLKPGKKTGVVVLGTAKSYNRSEVGPLAQSLLELLK